MGRGVWSAHFCPDPLQLLHGVKPRPWQELQVKPLTWPLPLQLKQANEPLPLPLQVWQTAA